MVLKKVFLITKTITLLMVLSVSSKVVASEADYVEKYCEGEIEKVLQDRTRVDCLTASTAWEYDFAKKWAESVGQALHYSRLTGKRPGIVLILEKRIDCRYVDRVMGIKNTFLPQLDVVVIGDCSPI